LQVDLAETVVIDEIDRPVTEDLIGHFRVVDHDIGRIGSIHRAKAWPNS
jgi:hypothetical protein